MKAHVIDRYKGPIRAADVPEPDLGDHDVLVDIHAASINPLDSRIRNGDFKLFLPYAMPLILGNDLAGVVLRGGSKVTRFAAGDKVYGRVDKNRIGTFAERIAVNERDLAPKPTTLTMPEAAAVPLVGLTAWQALVERADVQRGQKVLIHAGSGGLGTHAVQVAKHLDATVATTTSTRNLDWVADLGADVVIDYTTQDFETIARDYDVVLDTQGGKVLSKSLRVLKPGGIAIGVTGPPDPEFADQLGLGWPLRLAMTALSLPTRRSARRYDVRYSFLFMRADGAQLTKITNLIDSEAIRPVIDRTFPLESTADALAYQETGRAKGKVVLTKS
ncbi:NADP-dependent oxidoreductase [Parasphingorhabdus pacifica]